MKKLVLASLFAVMISPLTGCIISSDNGTNATITAHWDIKTVAGQSLSCPPTFDTAALYSQEVDANYNNIGGPTIDLFDCAAGTAISAPLNPTTYYSWITIANHDNSQQYASTVSAYVDLTNQDQVFSADIYDDGGYFQMAWQLTRASDGSALLCADVAGIDGVESISTAVAGSSQALVDQFQCGDHYGVTSVLPEGTYTVSVDAFNSSMQAIGTADTITNKTVSGPNLVTDLHTVTIPIDSL